MMGYCNDEWISDYTYQAIFDRILAVHRVAVSARSARPASSSGTETICGAVDTPDGPRCECPTVP